MLDFGVHNKRKSLRKLNPGDAIAFKKSTAPDGCIRHGIVQTVRPHGVTVLEGNKLLIVNVKNIIFDGSDVKPDLERLATI